MTPEVAEALLNQALPLGRSVVTKQAGLDDLNNPSASLEIKSDDLTGALQRVSGTLRQLGMAGAWRDELLSVRNPQGLRLGAVERGVVRPLGIATEAVHLVGFCTDGCLWVQQRALTKANDPGLWDTLMGGMISDADTLETALQRETWEEAGLKVGDLQDVRKMGRIEQYRPSDDGAGGYLQESTYWYRATVPDDLQPVNQDGEVAQFARLSARDVAQGLAQGHYTLEASLILVEALGLN